MKGAQRVMGDDDASRPGREPGHDVGPQHARRRRLWRVVAGLEVVVAATAVVLRDLLIPSLVLAAMAVLSLLVRREGLLSLGLRRVPAVPLALRMLAFAAVWTVVQLGVTLPLANHVSGTHQDLSEARGSPTSRATSPSSSSSWC